MLKLRGMFSRSVVDIFYNLFFSVAAKAKADAEAAVKAKNEAAEAAAIKKAEAELAEQLRIEKVNADIEAAHAKKQKEANDKFEAAKASLEKNGAEFVSQEEFAKLKASKAAGAA